MSAWSGWWEQWGLGRQQMWNLVLAIDASGTVTGSGEDCVGAFDISGRFAPGGPVSLIKQYHGRHAVVYEGCNSGEGVFGTWHLPGCFCLSGFNSGKFALYPRKRHANEHCVVQELKPACRGLAHE